MDIPRIKAAVGAVKPPPPPMVGASAPTTAIPSGPAPTIYNLAPKDMMAPAVRFTKPEMHSDELVAELQHHRGMVWYLPFGGGSVVEEVPLVSDELFEQFIEGAMMLDVLHEFVRVDKPKGPVDEQHFLYSLDKSTLIEWRHGYKRVVEWPRDWVWHTYCMRWMEHLDELKIAPPQYVAWAHPAPKPVKPSYVETRKDRIAEYLLDGDHPY